MQARAIDASLQVLGSGVHTILEGFGPFRILASRILHETGLGNLDETGMIHVDKNAWYPVAGFLRAFARIESQLGPLVIYKSGLSIQQLAQFPPGIHDVEAALHSMDVAYHLNHARNGEQLMNVKTGVMKDGIGHYLTRREGARRLVVACENPYPCDFDRGVVEGIARSFEPGASVTHSKTACRKLGGKACELAVEW